MSQQSENETHTTTHADKSTDQAQKEPAVQENFTISEEPYTIFSPRARWCIVALLGTAMLASPLTATIYLPLLPILARAFSVSQQKINLTITVYIVLQATAPILLASPSDYTGRRPIFLVSFTLFTFASLGLALTKSSYTALIVLRAVQSLGASAILSVSNAVVVDICTSVQRGRLLGPLMVTGNLGTAVGPIIGGWIVYGSREYRWAFVALVVFAGTILVLLVLFLPETARNVVGNGSVREKWWNRPIYQIVKQALDRKSVGNIEGAALADDEHVVVAKHKLVLKSPLDSVRVLFHADTSLIIWIGSTFYAAWYCIQASIPIIYENTYRFNELQIGLAYIPGAVGTIIGMYVSAQVADRLVKKELERLGKDYKDMKENKRDLSWFQFEKVRTRFCELLLITSFALYVGFGWLVSRKVHPAVPLTFQLVIGFVNTYICQVYGLLILDGFSHAAATAATANNVSRYALAAIATAVLSPCVNAIGYGWFMSGLGFLTGFLGLCAQILLRTCGTRWRRQRMNRSNSPRHGVAL